MVTTKAPWTQRRRNCWSLKIVVACCIVLFFLSPAFSRKLPADSKTYLGRSGLVERQVERRSEARGRILEEEGDEDGGELMNDYSTTHNHNGEQETPSPPSTKSGSRGTMRYGQQQMPVQFARYTAAYGHRHLRGV